MKKSYYDAELLNRKIQQLGKDGKCKTWLVDALNLLSERIESIPVEEDEDRYIVEFVYPH